VATDDETAGELIRRLRGTRTQPEVAAAIGVKPQAVSAWEHGGSISWKHARALDDYLEADGQIIDAFTRRAEQQLSRRGGPGSAAGGGAPMMQAVREIGQLVDSLADRFDEQDARAARLLSGLDDRFSALEFRIDSRGSDIDAALAALTERLARLEKQAGIEDPQERVKPLRTAARRRARSTPPPETP
jgi:transcriptional regulator with XRE-family HTH domain